MKAVASWEGIEGDIWMGHCQIERWSWDFSPWEPLKVLQHQKKVGKLSFRTINWLQPVWSEEVNREGQDIRCKETVVENPGERWDWANRALLTPGPEPSIERWAVAHLLPLSHKISLSSRTGHSTVYFLDVTFQKNSAVTSVPRVGESGPRTRLSLEWFSSTEVPFFPL